MNNYPRSALITHQVDNTPNGETFGISAILISNTWLLSHGSLLSPAFFETPRHDVRDFLEDRIDKLEKDVIAVPRRVAQSMKFSVRYHGLDEAAREGDCSMRYVWRCAHLRKTFNELLFSWNFEKLAKLDKSLLSIFLLLKIDAEEGSEEDDANEGRRVLNDLQDAIWRLNQGTVPPFNEFYGKHLSNIVKQPKRGAWVEIESTPFGNTAFLGSISRGIVSNVLGEYGSVILSDANAVPGCEGAPLFLLSELDKKRQVCGMVVASLSWCRGEWVDYTFVANLQSCLKRILKVQDKGEVADAAGIVRNESILLPDILDRSVVVVKCGSGWGTGVVVDAPSGTIVTCSHVVREIPGCRVKIGLVDDDGAGETQAWARLIYRTRDGQPYDVAVLKLEQVQENIVALPFASKLPDKGTTVLTAGFPFFAASPATCSRGIVSRRTCHVLQTTCCVQSGTSGGPVVDVNRGEILGLVVSNAVAAGTHDSGYNGTLYPRFNMSVPATVIKGPVMEYVRTGDPKCLESLSSSDPEVQKTWNFYLSPRSKI